MSNYIYTGSQLEGSVSGGTGYTYNWFLNGVNVNTTDVFSPSQNGDYVLTVTDVFNGCTITSDPVNVNNVSTGISEIHTEKLSSLSKSI